MKPLLEIIPLTSSNILALMFSLEEVIKQILTVDQIVEYAKAQGVDIPLRTIQEACKNTPQKPYGVTIQAVKIGTKRRGVWIALRSSVEAWVEQYKRKQDG